MADRIFVEGAPGALRAAQGVVLACLAVACEPTLVVGTWACPSADAGTDADGILSSVATPWSSGFEDGFCGYRRVEGFCYATSGGAFEIVTSPVHSGARAAAFRVATGGSPEPQARCARQGELPSAAYYGAWYYIPAAASELENWNLFHFQGGEGNPRRGLWDVTITADNDGLLRLSVYDFLRATGHNAAPTREVPIGAWFHIQVYLERAADATGAFALYQDGGQPLVELKGLITDDTNHGQWFVGNLARSLTPPESTIYVDDVTITDTL